jgi:HD superfamily phosphohydrolase
MARGPSKVRPATGKPIRMQELFVPVHGHITLYPEEVAVIDHPSFQRLRRVRQLGFAQLVFPGGVHTRLEHSIGAVHVAQLIVDHVNQNFRSSPDAQPGDWRIAEIDSDLARFIRLGALLHDVGHLPFGHTLEDELNHLRAHDGAVRLAKIGDRKFLHYDLDKSVSEFPKPTDGWSLRELVNALYQPFCNALGAD